MWEQIRRCNFQTGLSEQIGMEAFCGVNKKWAVKGKSWRADDVEFNLEASQAWFYFSEFISAWNGIKAPPRWVLSSMYFTSDRRPLGPCRHGTTQHECYGGTWSHRVRFHPRKGYRHVNDDPIKTYAAKLSSQKLTLLSHFITCKCGMKWNKWWNSSLNAGNAQVNCGVSTPCCLLAQLSWQWVQSPFLCWKQHESWSSEEQRVMRCSERAFLSPGLSQTALHQTTEARWCVSMHPHPTKEQILLPWTHCIQPFDSKAPGSMHFCRVLQIIPSKSWNQFTKYLWVKRGAPCSQSKLFTLNHELLCTKPAIRAEHMVGSLIINTKVTAPVLNNISVD